MGSTLQGEQVGRSRRVQVVRGKCEHRSRGSMAGHVVSERSDVSAGMPTCRLGWYEEGERSRSDEWWPSECHNGKPSDDKGDAGKGDE